MRKFLVLAALMLLLAPFSLCADASLWNFSYSGESASCASLPDGSIEVNLTSGVAYLSTELSNITGTIEKGERISLNLTVWLSPYVISSGMKVVIGNDTVFSTTLSSGTVSYHFYVIRNYNSTARIVIVLYSYGGNMRLHMSPLLFEKPKKGLPEGFFLSGVGISVVFSVLGILAVVMYALGSTIKEKEKKDEMYAPESSRDSSSRSVEEMDDEIIAAITGAIALYLGGKKFRIISVKPSPWKLYGRLSSMRR